MDECEPFCAEYLAIAREQMPYLDILGANAQERLAMFINVHNMMLVHITYKYGLPGTIWQRRKVPNEMELHINVFPHLSICIAHITQLEAISIRCNQFSTEFCVEIAKDLECCGSHLVKRIFEIKLEYLLGHSQMVF